MGSIDWSSAILGAVAGLAFFGGSGGSSGSNSTKIQVVQDGLTVHVDALLPDGAVPVNMVWDFGDGSQGVGVSMSHTYAAPGTYTIKLVAELENGGVVLRRTITVGTNAQLRRF